MVNVNEPGSTRGTAFEASSPDISFGTPIDPRFIFSGFGCTGQNLSPEITWRNPPPGTRSLAVLVHDPDAPTGGAGFWHWAVVDIPPTCSNLPQGAGSVDGTSLPSGARQLRSDYGSACWGGPCPPEGDEPHRYIFTVYALDVARLELPTDATTSLAGFMINASALASASFTGHYGR